MANIPRKFLEDIDVIEYKGVLSGGQVKDEVISTTTIKGAIFPLSGKEIQLVLQGLLKKDSLKVYTNSKLDTTKNFKVEKEGITYKFSGIVGDFKTDTLNIYFLEVRE